MSDRATLSLLFDATWYWSWDWEEEAFMAIAKVIEHLDKADTIDTEKELQCATVTPIKKTPTSQSLCNPPTRGFESDVHEIKHLF